MGGRVIQICKGCVDFGSFALEIPELTLNPGMYWLTGPNGSGKTTLLRVLLGLQKLTIGNIESKVSECGYLPQGYRETVFPWLSATQNLNLFGENLSFVNEWITRLGLTSSELDRRSHQLSGGQAQRLALVREASLLPELLVLDEPFASLDVSSVQVAGEMIADVNDAVENITLITSHTKLPDSLMHSKLIEIQIERVTEKSSRVSLG